MENSTANRKLTKRASMSFAPSEVALLCDMVKAACMSDIGMLHSLTRRNEFGALAQKSAAMRAKLRGVESERVVAQEQNERAAAEFKANVQTLAAAADKNIPRAEIARLVASELNVPPGTVDRFLRPAGRPSTLTAAESELVGEYRIEIERANGAPVAAYTVNRLAAKHGVALMRAVSICSTARKNAMDARKAAMMGEAAE